MKTLIILITALIFLLPEIIAQENLDTNENTRNITMEEFLRNNEVGDEDLTIDDIFNVQGNTWYDIVLYKDTTETSINPLLPVRKKNIWVKSLKLIDTDGSVYLINFEKNEKQTIKSIERVDG